MSSDVKIPDWAEKAAQDFHDKWETGMSGAAFRDLVRALLAAEQRGRKAGLEEAARVADDRVWSITEISRASDYEAASSEAADEIAAAIRSLGEKT